MTGRDHAAVGHGVEESLAPIPGGVKSYGEPEIASAPQCQTEEEADERRGQQASPVFALIPQMNQPKTARQDQRRRPEADAARQRKLAIAAEQILLEQSHQQKH